MNKTLTLSLLASAALFGADIKLTSIGIEATQITEVSQNAQTSADVADALSQSVPSIDMSRRSGIANDVFIRGQKRDNISIDVDGTKIYGACPNRMDPPVSHILANQIESIAVIEGPYDVENFGTLSGGLQIKTKRPKKKKEGSLHFAFGAFNYKKVGATISGGNEKIRLLLTSSIESSDQYRDGNGDTLASQLLKKGAKANRYKTEYFDAQSYDKRSLNAKAFVKLAKDQELQLSFTANRSSNILYPNSPMDAPYDNSDIYSIAYEKKNLSKNYKQLKLQYYYSKVDHPMSTRYRNASNMAAMDITNAMASQMQGIKLKNSFLLGEYKLLAGIDVSQRAWSGEYKNTTTGAYKADSISDTTTQNSALFAKITKKYGSFESSFGLRYDRTKIDNSKNLQDNDYSALSANILSTYHINSDNKLFFGLGEASRVPDARELYFLKGGQVVGTPTLKQTTNQEADFGYESDNDDFKFKTKLFYSLLKNYIYIKKGATSNAFENIDAILYGLELSGSYYLNDDMTLDMGASYKRGVKNAPLTAQSDKDLADIAPLRGNIALNYEYKNNSIATIEIQASDKWSQIDSDNGEQELGAWSILNMKVKHAVNKKFDCTVGVNNLFDATYATSNTYADLNLVVTGTSDTMLLNEPGRYIYTNLDFKF